jgi:dipeptidyl aminopeptidase/acylaminoacyl peptidase
MLAARFILAAILMILALEPSGARARGYTLNDYAGLVGISDAQIAPDGKRIVYQRRALAMGEREQWVSTLWLVDTDGRKDRPLIRGHSPRWSPQGNVIAYIGTDAAGQEQLFHIDPKTKVITQLTGSALKLHDHQWSPDGRQIAFRALDPLPITAEHPDMPAAQKDAKRRAPPVAVDTLHYRQEGEGLLPGGKMQIYLVSAAGGDARPATRAAFNHVAYEGGTVNILGNSLAWSPDSQTLYFDGDNHPDQDRRILRSQIHALTIATGTISTIAGDDAVGKSFFHNPQISGDGRMLSFAGYRWNAAHARRLNTIWAIDLTRGDERQLTPPLTGDADIIGWDTNNKGIFFQVDDGVRRITRHVSLDGELRDAIAPPAGHIFTATSKSRGEIAGLLAKPSAPAEAAILRVGKNTLQTVTQHNEGKLAGVDMGRIIYTTLSQPDGVKIDAILRLPAGHKIDAHFPLIVWPHGGPHNADQGDFDAESAHYAGAGFGVLRINYRGSTGYGEAFTNHTFNRFPSKEAISDILVATDWAVTKGADANDLHLAGPSAGGMIGIATLGTTARFKSAVILRPIVDTAVHDLITDEAGWAHAQFAEPTWQNPDHRRSVSPLSVAHKITTPTLIMTGEADLRTPLVESEMLFATMKLVGKTNVRLLRFPGVGHGVGPDFATWARYQLHTLSWIKENRHQHNNPRTKVMVAPEKMENKNAPPKP